MLARLDVEAREVRLPEDLAGIEALIIPGGESTTIGKLAARFGLIDPLRDLVEGGLPALGTCAGLILLAGQVVEGDQHLLGVLDVVVRRNAFGRQNESFEAQIDIAGFETPFTGVFIRAPWVAKAGQGVEVLATVEDHPVMVRQGRMIGTSFHPELTSDVRIHQMLLEMI